MLLLKKLHQGIAGNLSKGTSRNICEELLSLAEGAGGGGDGGGGGGGGGGGANADVPLSIALSYCCSLLLLVQD